MLSGHGDDLYSINRKIKYNFSSNVFYKGCPKMLLEHVSQTIGNIENYPSPTAHELNELAAEKFNLNNNQFLFTNGATEAFYLIAQLYTGKRAGIVAPTFSEYEDACKIHQVNYQLIKISEIKDTAFDVLFICNPNNPDGSIFSTEELEVLFKTYANTIFVIDEAYIEFTNQTVSIVHLTQTYANLIVVRSLTKTFAIPGLRLGYMVANSKIINQLLTLKMPWTVNTIAIEAGKYIFKHYNQLQFDVGELLEETHFFKQQFSNISWLEIIESNTPYFLVRLHQKTARDLKQYLIKEHQILVRDATNFNGLEGEYIRLSTQHQKANQTLINALQAWI